MIRAAFVLVLSLLASSVQAQTRVPAGANLQAALDAALPGDVLELDAGATFTGNYTLPVKNGTAPVTVRTRGLTLPNTRIDPAANLATLRTPNSAPALRTVGNTAHWRFDGIRFAAGASQSDIVALGDTVTADVAQLPRDLVFDRSIFQADTSAKNGLSLNSAETTIRRSRFTGIKLAGIESHAIVCTNGPGPFTIEDNYIEAGSIGVLFGGAAPAVPNLVPSDIVFQRNTVTRPLALRSVTGYGIKNAFELKNARRVTVRGNLFEHNWPDGQAGWTITITVRANSTTAPWTTIQHVLFEHNIVRHAAAGFNILGLDNQVSSPGAPVNPSTPMDDVVIRDNLVYDLDRWAWTGPRGELGNGVFMQIDGGPRNLHVEDNTALGNGNILNLLGPPIPGFVFRRNIVQKVRSINPATGSLVDSYGVNGNTVGEGNPALSTYCPHVDGYPDVVFTGNVLAGATASQYTLVSGNVFPSAQALMADFVDPASGNYRLVPTSSLRTLPTGMPGADQDAIEQAMVRSSPSAVTNVRIVQ